MISRVLGWSRWSGRKGVSTPLEDKSILGGWGKNNEVIWSEGSKLIANPTER